MNIYEHPIYKSIYDLCLEIEKLPASEQETKVVVMAGELEKPARELIAELRKAEAACAVMVEALKMAAALSTGQDCDPAHDGVVVAAMDAIAHAENLLKGETE
jgi:hypothetical protein